MATTSLFRESHKLNPSLAHRKDTDPTTLECHGVAQAEDRTMNTITMIMQNEMALVAMIMAGLIFGSAYVMGFFRGFINFTLLAAGTGSMGFYLYKGFNYAMLVL